MGEASKNRTYSRRKGGYYPISSTAGNSNYLSWGEFGGDIFEVREQENINYQTGNPFNRCTHSKVVSSYFIPANMAEMTSDHLLVTPGDYSLGTLPIAELGESRPIGVHTRGATVSHSIPLVDIENARLDGYNRLIHMVPSPHMNVARSIMELKDTKQTLKPILNFIGWVKQKLGSRVPGPKGVPVLVGVATKIATLASAYLWYQFGVEPTVSDVRRFLKELSNGRLAVRGHKPRVVKRGTVVVGRYSLRLQTQDVLALMFPNARDGVATWNKDVTLSRGTSPYPVAIVPNGVPDPFYCRGVHVLNEIKGCYFAAVKDDIVISGLEGLRSRFAWNCPGLTTLWDLLPFSFLVDWLVDVHSAIERLERRYLTANYSKSFGATWRCEKTSSVLYSPGLSSIHVQGTGIAPPDSPYSGGILNIDGTAKLSCYRSSQVSTFKREPASVPTLVTPRWDATIDAYRISTGMALLVQAAKAWL